MRLSLASECKDKDSVWETLENEVLAAILKQSQCSFFFFFNKEVWKVAGPFNIDCQLKPYMYIRCKKPLFSFFPFFKSVSCLS